MEVYLFDTVVVHGSINELINHEIEFLYKVPSHRLVIQEDKRQFTKTSAVFLEHIVSCNNV